MAYSNLPWLRAGSITFLLVAGSLGIDGQQVLPIDDQVQVNTFTTGTQQWTAVSLDGPNRILASWMTSDSEVKPANFVMRGRRYIDGEPIGDEFEINSYTGEASHAHVAVDVLPSGEFVVVWDSNGVTGTDDFFYSIQARLFEEDGTSPIGDQFQVNTHTISNQRRADLATVASSGDFIIVWQSVLSPIDDDSVAILGRRYDSAGNPRGTDFQANSYTTHNQVYPHVSARPTGEFLVVWESGRLAMGPDGDGAGVRAQRYDAQGLKVGLELAVNTETLADQRWPQAEHDSAGGFVVTWHSTDGGTDGDGWSVRGRKFTSIGLALGAELQVSTSTAGDQSYTNLAFTNDDGFIVVWQSEDSPDDFEIRARRFNPDGSPRGDDFLINTYSTGSQIRPAIDILGDEMVVIWESYGSPGSDDADRSIQLRRFRVPIFADGFESGDLTAWDNG